jgi:hypothetical protein
VSRLARVVPVLLVVALLGGAMLAAVASQISFTVGPTIEPTPPLPSHQSGPTRSAAPPELGGRDNPPYVLPDWIGYLLAGLCLSVVLVLAVALLWSVFRDRLVVRKSIPEVVDAEEVRRRMREQVRAAVDEGLSDLDVMDTDPRRAVIACWARLEAAAAAAGTAREPGDTSTELVERLLAEHAITVPVLADFAATYREARFATHVVDEAMRDRARAALRQVRDELVATADA